MTDDKKESIIIAVVVIAFIIGIATTIGVTVKTNKENRQVSTTQSVEKEEASQANAAEDNAAAENSNGGSASNGSNSGNSSNSGNKPASGGSNSGGSSNSGNKPAPKPTQPKPQPKPEPTKPKPSPEPETRPTQAGSRPLNSSEKQWVIDNYFWQFVGNGALPNFNVKDIGCDNGLTRKVVLNNNNYQDRINAYKQSEALGEPSLLQSEAKNCELVKYWFTEEKGQTVLYYKPCKGY